jgi:hypothetical protein
MLNIVVSDKHIALGAFPMPRMKQSIDENITNIIKSTGQLTSLQPLNL